MKKIVNWFKNFLCNVFFALYKICVIVRCCIVSEINMLRAEYRLCKGRYDFKTCSIVIDGILEDCALELYAKRVLDFAQLMKICDLIYND